MGPHGPTILDYVLATKDAELDVIKITIDEDSQLLVGRDHVAIGLDVRMACSC